MSVFDLRSLADDKTAQIAWIQYVRGLPAPERIALIYAAIAALQDTPTVSVIFWRKSLLRLHDESRLAAGLVTRDQLQRENSPFRLENFAKATVSFKPRSARV